MLVLVVVCLSLFNLVANPIGVASSGPLGWLGAMCFGAMLAQPVLFAEWAVFGPGVAIRRVPFTIFLAAVVALTGFYTGWSFLNGTRASTWNEIDYLYIWGYTLPVASTLLLVVQKLTHWKISRLSEMASSTMQSKQFSLKYLLGLTAICAALLGTARTLGSHQWPGISPSWQSGAVGLLVGLGLALLAIFPAFTVPFVAILPRPTMRVLIGLPLAWAALTWLTVETVLVLEPKETRSGVAHDVVFLQCGAASIGLLSALAVRFAGYRLLVGDNRMPASAIGKS